MSVLDRKLARDLWQMKGQALAICLIIASGMAMFVMSFSTLKSLKLSQSTYYERYRFAHVFGHLKRAPNVLAARIAEIPGVASVQTRVLHKLLREGRVLSGAHLLVDSNHSAELHHQLKNTPRVAGVFDREATLRGFQETISENLLRMRTYNIVFACIIAFGVIYNTARVSLSERARELASLRVLGFTRTEISFILLGELAILTLAALPLGMGIGLGFAALTVWGFDTELYRIPLVVDRSTYAFAATVTLLASLVSGFIVRRRLDRLDLIAALKSQE